MSAPLMPQPRHEAGSRMKLAASLAVAVARLISFLPTSGDLEGPATRVLRHPAG